MSTRWERLLDTKPIPLQAHLLEEVARLLDAEFRAWPPNVEELDVATGGGFVDFLSADAPRPPKEAFAEALRLTRWELQRENDAIDDYFRNRRYREAGLEEAGRPALLFLGRWLLEQLLSLGEATEGRVKRPDMVRVLDRLEALRTASAPA
jgi:hypothetical protein